ncbi:AAA family ATPase [Bacillus pacificus]
MKVSNYRLLKNMNFDMEENLSLIIGKNNCGKHHCFLHLKSLLE